MDFYSVESFEDEGQNEKIKELMTKVDLISQKLGIEFAEKEIEEEYENFWGTKKKRMSKTFIVVNKQ